MAHFIANFPPISYIVTVNKYAHQNTLASLTRHPFRNSPRQQFPRPTPTIIMDMFDERRLLTYATYADYLDSFVSRSDLCYLRSSHYGRLLAELGYRSTSEMLSKRQFEQRKAAIHEMLYPTRKPHRLISMNLDSDDELLRELAERERPNRLCMLSTIIYLSHRNRVGGHDFEISGYIDYEQSIRHSIRPSDGAESQSSTTSTTTSKTAKPSMTAPTDWYAVFHENRRLWPTPSDLGYYNWRSGQSVINDTENYKAITDPIDGLIFISRHDRKHIRVDPSLESPGNCTTRTLVRSDRYDHIVLYDHVVRMKT